MVTNRKPTGRASSIPAGLAVGAAVNVVITCFSALALGKLVDSQKMQWENIGYGIMLLLLAASFAGACAAYAKIKRQRLMVCLLSGMVYFAILLSVTALFFGGQYEAVGVTAALVLAGSGTAGLLGLGSKRGGKTGKLRRHYR